MAYTELAARSVTELLSKDRTILERPFMEFRPFGADEHGGKIRDISGTIVRANVEHLEACVSHSSGPEPATHSAQELCRLLNERIRDPAYHVTTKLLNNIWNSYSYEFVCYGGNSASVCPAIPNFISTRGATSILRQQHASWASTFRLPRSFRCTRFCQEIRVARYGGNQRSKRN